VVAAGWNVTSLSDLLLLGSTRWISSDCLVKCGECCTGVAGQICEGLECLLSQQGQTTLVRHILEYALVDLRLSKSQSDYNNGCVFL
jgi:hypothetical protein